MRLLIGTLLTAALCAASATTPMQAGDSSGWDFIELVQFDCRQQMQRQLSTGFENHPLLGGEYARIADKPSNWRHERPDSTLGRIAATSCATAG